MNKITTCRICGNTFNNSVFIAKELMYGTNEEFSYFQCADCGCLQIEEIPEEMARYYPSDYLSFGAPVFFKKVTRFKSFLKARLTDYYSIKFNLVGYLLSFYYKNEFPFINQGIVTRNSKILDIGCGTGKLLLTLQRHGFKNLTGIDPYNEDTIFYENNLTIYKSTIFELNGEFDFIMLHHSIEHMESPADVLKRLKSMLTRNGTILIRIPLANSFAWRKYQTSWVQLDAPRHFYLHTIRSMSILADKCGLKVTDVQFDSTVFQFIGSEKYLRGLSFHESNDMFTKKQLKAFEIEARRLNAIHDGDTACFYLKHRL